jgi:hypothetical protein
MPEGIHKALGEKVVKVAQKTSIVLLMKRVLVLIFLLIVATKAKAERSKVKKHANYLLLIKYNILQ